MGILPLQFADGESRATLALTGEETIEIHGITEGLAPGKRLTVKAGAKTFSVVCRINTPQEIGYYANGGILQYVLRQLAR